MTKFFTPKRLALSLALTGAVLPVALIGCGGGNGVGPLKTRTGVTPTPVTPQTLALTPATFTLQNGQRVTLTGTRTGTQLKGNLKVAAAPLSRLQTGSQNVAFPFSIAVGNYGYTGTFTPPRGFTIVGDFGALGSFTMSGQLQTTTQNGSYSLTTNGVTDSGIIPALNSNPTPAQTVTPVPNATATPIATTIPTPVRTPFVGGTATPAPSPTPIASEFQANAQFSGRSSDLSASTFNFGGTLVRGNADGEFYGSEFSQPLGGTVSAGTRTLSLSVIGKNKQPAVAGDSYSINGNLSGTMGGASVVYKETYSDGKTASWLSQSGTMQVVKYDSSGVTLRFNNVRMTANPNVSSSFVSGSFTLTGQGRGPLR